jgi:hypothetical protein
VFKAPDFNQPLLTIRKSTEAKVVSQAHKREDVGSKPCCGNSVHSIQQIRRYKFGFVKPEPRERITENLP